MSTQIICPDCGGVIGSTEPGEAPCTCFQSGTVAQNGGIDLAQGGNDSPSLSDTQPVAEVTKVCAGCGKNVAGHKRFKDSRGYLCVECNRKEIEADREGKVKCAECGRRVKPAGLVEFRGTMVCRFCREGHLDLERKKPKLVSSKNFDRAERQNIMNIAIVLLVLAILMVIGWFKMRKG